MPKITVKSTAERIAARVDAAAVGFDPITIITILLAVLPVMLKCFGQEDEPTPEKVNAAIKRQHESNPARLLRRTAVRVRQEAKQKENKRLSKDQAETLARAMIAEAVEATPARVASLCYSVM